MIYNIISVAIVQKHNSIIVQQKCYEITKMLIKNEINYQA